jgi:cytochrome c biogenesis protein CcdA
MGKIFFSLLVLLSNAIAGEPKVRMLFFYSEKCDHCHEILTNMVPRLMQTYPLEIKYLEVNDPNNYQLLLAAEAFYNDHTNKDYPIIFFDKYTFSGLREIVQGLEQKVTAVANQGGCEFPDLSQAPLHQDTILSPEEIKAAGGQPIYLAYFYQTGCKLCSRVAQDLQALRRLYPQLVVKEYDIEKNRELNEALGEYYDVDKKQRLSGPMVFVGNDYLHGEDVTHQALKALVDKYLTIPTLPPWEIEVDKEQVKKTLVERFRSIGILTIVLAGLIDGINPCAFATLVFFISYLAVAGRTGREIIVVGLAFTTAIFLTYFAVGLGFFHFIKSLSFIPLLSKIVYIGTAIIAGGLAIGSFYDAWKYRQGRYDESLLSLPGFLRQRLNKVMVRQFRIRNMALGAFAAGAAVSLLEFACTGQVYLPTIIFATQLPEYKMHGMALLALYNLAFVLPLIVVFLLACRGSSSQNLQNILKRYAPQVKLGMGVFFLLLAGMLIVYI